MGACRLPRRPLRRAAAALCQSAALSRASAERGSALGPGARALSLDLAAGACAARLLLGVASRGVGRASLRSGLPGRGPLVLVSPPESSESAAASVSVPTPDSPAGSALAAEAPAASPSVAGAGCGAGAASSLSLLAPGAGAAPSPLAASSSSAASSSAAGLFVRCPRRFFLSFFLLRRFCSCSCAASCTATPCQLFRWCTQMHVAHQRNANMARPCKAAAPAFFKCTGTCNAAASRTCSMASCASNSAMAALACASAAARSSSVCAAAGALPAVAEAPAAAAPSRSLVRCRSFSASRSRPSTYVRLHPLPHAVSTCPRHMQHRHTTIMPPTPHHSYDN